MGIALAVSFFKEYTELLYGTANLTVPVLIMHLSVSKTNQQK
jgi:hypothetical protein